MFTDPRLNEMLIETPLTPLMKAIQNMTLETQTTTYPFYMGNELPPDDPPDGYNRRVRRYAEKHNVSLDKAFAAIYGKKGE